MATTNIIYNVIKNKYYFKLFKSYFKSIINYDRDDWRYKYDHWTNLTDLITHKHINLLRYRLKRGDHVEVSVESIKLFCQNVKDDVEVFRMVYERYRDYFLSPDLLLKVTSHGNFEIIKLLADQTSPVTLMRTRRQIRKSKKNTRNEYHYDNILSRAFEMNHFQIYFYLLGNVLDEDGKPLKDSIKPRLDELMARDPKKIVEVNLALTNSNCKSIRKKDIECYMLENKDKCITVGNLNLAKKLGVPILWSQEQFGLAYEIALLLPVKTHHFTSIEYHRQPILSSCHTIPYNDHLKKVLKKLRLANRRLSEVGLSAHALLEDSDQFKLLARKFIIIEESERQEIQKQRDKRQYLAMLIENVSKECIETGEPLAVSYLLEKDKNKQLQIFKLLIKCPTKTNAQWIVACKTIEKSNIFSTPQNAIIFLNLLSDIDYISQENIEFLIPIISRVIENVTINSLSVHLLKIVDLYKKSHRITIYNIKRLKVLVDYDTLATFLAKNKDMFQNTNNSDSTIHYIGWVCNEVYQVACRNGRLDYVTLVEDRLSIRQIEIGLVCAIRGRHRHIIDHIIEQHNIKIDKLYPNLDLLIDILKLEDTEMILDFLKPYSLWLKTVVDCNWVLNHLNSSPGAYIKLADVLPQLYGKSAPNLFCKSNMEHLLFNNKLMNKKHWAVIHKYDQFKSMLLLNERALVKAIEDDNVELLSLIYEQSHKYDSYFEEFNQSFSKKIINEIIPSVSNTIVKNNCLTVLLYLIKISAKLDHSPQLFEMANSASPSLYLLLKQHKNQSNYLRRVNNQLKVNTVTKQYFNY